MVLRYARKRGNQRGLRNLKFAVLGGPELLAKYVAPGSVAEVAIYHPQPYHDPAKRHRRLISPEFLELVRTALAPGGRVIVQTDSPGYWKVIQELMPQFFEFHERIGRWPDSPHGRTRRGNLRHQARPAGVPGRRHQAGSARFRGSNCRRGGRVTALASHGWTQFFGHANPTIRSVRRGPARRERSLARGAL